MPTNRRTKRVRRRGAGLSRYDQTEIDCLICTGQGFLCRELDGNEKSIADAWKLHGERVLESYIGNRPGQRPFAWWRHAAPEPWPQIEEQFAAFGESFEYPLADRESVVWHRFQLQYLRKHGVMGQAESAAAAERETVEAERLARLYPDTFEAT